jgi:hypothetical protein
LGIGTHGIHAHSCSLMAPPRAGDAQKGLHGSSLFSVE